MEIGNRKMEVGNGKSETVFTDGKPVRRAYVINARELEVYKLAYRLSLEIHHRSLSFPKIEQYGGIADQMRRATKSICANLAEGFSNQTQSLPEFRRFISMAIGSSGEVNVWLVYCMDLDYIDASTHRIWSDGYQAISKMLQKLRNSIKSSSNF